jgi:hypothetical protein
MNVYMRAEDDDENGTSSFYIYKGFSLPKEAIEWSQMHTTIKKPPSGPEDISYDPPEIPEPPEWPFSGDPQPIPVPGYYTFILLGDDYGYDSETVYIEEGGTYNILLELPKQGQQVTEQAEAPLSDNDTVTIKGGFVGGGSFHIVDITDIYFDADGHLDRPTPVFNVTSEGGELAWAYLEVAIGTWPQPEWPEPERLRLFYWDEVAEDWVMTEASGVDVENGVVWGYSTHLTTFSIQEVSAEPEDKEKDDGLGAVGMLILFMVFVIVLIPLAAVMVRKI